MTPIGPHSRPGKLAVVDGRRAEARRLKQIRLELTQHIGNAPSAAQRMMIDRLAMLTLRVELMDKEAMDSGAMTDHSSRQYLAWTNSISKLLRHLGLQGVAQRAPSLQDHLDATYGHKAA